ncbi:MAG: hypothetical protein Q8O01_04025 [Candidatus Omnitrophota bacterium]|nr:hypothetical protein [Candidatus Omnitrophota bacterium]
MTNILHKRGFVLIMATLFIVIAVVASVGIYSYSEYIVHEVRTEKKAAAKSYYCAVAGARYAQIVLKNPMDVARFGFTTAAFNGETKTMTITGHAAGTLGEDLDFRGNDTLTITATEINTTDNPNSYQVETIFTY